MQTNIKNRLVNGIDWWNNINDIEYFLVLTDDLDSLLSCNYLESNFGIRIGGFYNFNNLYINQETSKGKKAIFIDLDTTSERCFGNHVTFGYNSKSINLNRGINGMTYKSKYSGSTYEMVLSLYNVDFTKMNTDELIFTLCPDSGFMGFYNNSFKPTFMKWQTALRYPYEILNDIDESEFVKVQEHYNLKSKIALDNNHQLRTNIKIEKLNKKFPSLNLNLPNDKFDFLKADFETKRMPEIGYIEKSIKEGKIFSAARTKKYFANASFYSNIYG